MDPKQLLIAHFEKVILAIAVFWLGYAAYGLTWNPPELRVKEEIQGKIKTVSEYVATHQATEGSLPDWESDINENLLPTSVGGAKQYPTWAFHRRPSIVFKFKKPKRIQEAEHFPPSDVAAVSERGKITISWAAGKDNAFIIIDNFEVLRRDGDGDYTSLATVGGDTTEYVDKDINARTAYSYKVRSIAVLNKDDPIVQRMPTKELAEDKRKRDSDESEAVRIPREIVVMPVTWSKPTNSQILKEGRDRDLKGKVAFYVYVYIGGEGKDAWVRYKFRNIEGGLPKPARVGDKKDKTRKVKGREDPVSFYTGGVLIDCGSEVREGSGGINGKRKGCFMEIKYPDGSSEKVNSFDYPEEIAAWEKKR